MLYYLSDLLQHLWGPFRLLKSHALLLGGGAFTAALLIGLFLPKLWDKLPRDRGKVLCKDLGGMKSAGKPTGAGFYVTLLALPVLLVFVPLSVGDVCALIGMYAAMIFGYLDDKAEIPWGELKKGLLDAVCALLIALAIAFDHGTTVWFPFVKTVWEVPFALYVPAAAFLLWFTMNATNCSDGVDGLAGSLTEITLVMMSIFLYVIVGYQPVAEYFLLPTNPDGARWSILLMTVAGSFGGYLWFNAEPSKILMGDAGSRFLGILVGAAVLISGNPFLILAVAPIVLVNGGGGLAKLVLLRTAKKLKMDISDDAVIKRIRFPLHDHCKKNLGWSNAQVLMRFILLQLIFMPILLLIFVKVR